MLAFQKIELIKDYLTIWQKAEQRDTDGELSFTEQRDMDELIEQLNITKEQQLKLDEVIGDIIY